MARYDICVPRPKKDGGTYWHKIGAAFDSDKGGFSLEFDSLPGPSAEQDRDGNIRIRTRAVAFPSKDDERSGSRDRRDAQARGGQQPAMADDLDDSVPF